MTDKRLNLFDECAAGIGRIRGKLWLPFFRLGIILQPTLILFHTNENGELAENKIEWILTWFFTVSHAKKWVKRRLGKCECPARNGIETTSFVGPNTWNIIPSKGIFFAWGIQG